MFASDDPWENDTSNGCAPGKFQEIDPASGYVILRLEEALNLPSFSHEIGHIFGGWHERRGSGDPFFNFLADCGFAHIFDDLFDIERRTIMEIASGNILHYSNPHVNFNGVPTGEIVDPGRDADNVAVINSTGCMVSDFRPSLNTNALVEVISVPIQGSVTDCDLVLESVLSPQVSGNFSFSWYWSLEGIFASQYPGVFMGEGNQFTVPQPVDDPCESYFVQLIVEDENDNVIDIVIINLKGNECVDYVDDPCTTNSSNLSIFNNTNLYNSVNEVQSDNTQNSFKENNKFEQNKYLVFDISGRILISLKDYENFHSIHSTVNQFYSGVYFVLIIDSFGQKIVTRHVSLK